MKRVTYVKAVRRLEDAVGELLDTQLGLQAQEKVAYVKLHEKRAELYDAQTKLAYYDKDEVSRTTPALRSLTSCSHVPIPFLTHCSLLMTGNPEIARVNGGRSPFAGP